MPTDRPIQRGSWGIEIDQPIHIPPGDPIALRHETQNPDIALDRYHLRVDWQTRVSDDSREAKSGLLTHKNTWNTEATVLPALELWEREQNEQGIIPRDWQPATLDDYPYYPGWEERWNATQSV
ncbi:hypothetical protein ANOM_007077 [Aspergillus nomiae NRRL 13137]|uniref:Uncharacterized protein n=1 Tax=Aspergillus nomiae NRRL (strain ATCC 15546 / NRRL 13137 / CBS 260.88 / M93) TaxID=1509407 RepID=A0A0L1J033_ASPN3|nr:uncharacterized protein ANOM_007077 [Aspergillus nomiae NRRL 13137]KNG85129.1 hypothetical protein ANOM_007077 [Aspergillus nomiae NRRL 13137]